MAAAGPLVRRGYAAGGGRHARPQQNRPHGRPPVRVVPMAPDPDTPVAPGAQGGIPRRGTWWSTKPSAGRNWANPVPPTAESPCPPPGPWFRPSPWRRRPDAAPAPPPRPTRRLRHGVRPGDQGGIHAYDVRPEGRARSSRSTARPGRRTRSSWPSPRTRSSCTRSTRKQFGGKENEQVAAYQVVGRTGELKLLNRQSAEGTAACYLDVDKTGKTVARGELLVGQRRLAAGQGRRVARRARRRSSSTRARA